MLVILFMMANPVLAEDSEQHDFGSGATPYDIYSFGKTFDFSAVNTMTVHRIDATVRLSGPSTINISLSVNGTEITRWSHNPTFSLVYYNHEEEIEFNVTSGDTITIKLWGGTSSEAAGIVSGPNHLILYYSDPVTISPEAFRVAPGTIKSTFDSPDTWSYGLTYDGTNLWLGGAGAHKIYKLDRSGNVLNSFASPDAYPYGLAYDGTDLWVAGYQYSKIFKIDTSGNVLDSFDTPDGGPVGLTFDGTNLWHVGLDTYKIYKLDTSGNILDSFDSPDTTPLGLAFDGTHLWFSGSTTDRIFKLDTSGNVLDFFDSPDTSAIDLAFDGTNLWVSGSGTEDDIIYELFINVRVGCTHDETFTVQNNTHGTVDIGALSIVGTDHSEFTVTNDNCSGITLDEDETCTLDLVFTAASPGGKTATLQVPTSDAVIPRIDVPLTAEVSGKTPYDFNSDGKSDLIFRHPDSGKVGAWLMDGYTEDTWRLIGNHGTAWDIKAVDDLNQDAFMDIIYRHTNGNIGVWLMNGTTETTWHLIGNHGTGWDIKGAGDFNNNGKSDLLYRHTNGNIGVWLMDGTSEDTWHLIGNHGTSWNVYGVADFDRDGYADVLYRHNDGRVGVWLMNGTSESSWHLIGNHGPAWTPKCLSDYNADSDIDIVYRHNGGNVGVWLMDGLTESTWRLIGNHGTWDVR